MSTRDAIEKLLEGIRKDINKDQAVKGIRASGKSAESQEIYMSPAAGRLVGDASFHEQVKGRRPGAFPPIADIRAWIDTKGIDPQDISKDSLAFLIARKIARRGTDIYLGKRPGLDLDLIIQRRREEFEGDITDIKRVEYSSAITAAFKKSQAALPV
jgi:hypothetical protein